MAQNQKFNFQQGLSRIQSCDSLYECDHRPTAVDAYMNSHLLTEGQNPYHSVLENIRQNSLTSGLRDIACPPPQAKFLKLQIQMCRAKNILEVGTLGGYSAGWMATADPSVKVTTIEINKQIIEVARKNLTDARLAGQVEILHGPGLDILPQLASEIQSHQRMPFDFVFIDANKQDNLAYFNHAISMTGPRATIIVDNVVRDGKVISTAEAEKDVRVAGARQVIEGIGRDDRVDATVIQTVGEKGYDGFLIAVKK